MLPKHVATRKANAWRPKVIPLESLSVIPHFSFPVASINIHKGTKNRIKDVITARRTLKSYLPDIRRKSPTYTRRFSS